MKLLFLIKRLPPRSPLFPYTTLFRSVDADLEVEDDRCRVEVVLILLPVRGGDAVDVGAAHERVARHVGHEPVAAGPRSEEHTSELQSRQYLVCRLLLEKKILPRSLPGLAIIQSILVRASCCLRLLFDSSDRVHHALRSVQDWFSLC